MKGHDDLTKQLFRWARLRKIFDSKKAAGQKLPGASFASGAIAWTRARVTWAQVNIDVKTLQLA